MFRFTLKVQRSAFSERDVVLVDHDHAGNQGWVRRFHDELVRVDDGLYLSTSHLRRDDGLRFAAWFALARR